jgi:diguanylate cyclase
MPMLSRDSLLQAVAREQLLLAQDEASAILVVHLGQQRRFRTEFGYAASDRINTATMRLLEQVLRPADLVCRIADDTFALLLPGLRSENHALLAANRVVRALRDELRLDDIPVRAAAAIGIAVLEPDVDPEHLLRRADLAATEAGRGGRPVQHGQADHTFFALPTQALDAALRSNRLEAWLQPLWDFRSNRVIGAESLARWRCPDRGDVSPSLFVPLAEQSELIDDLTRWSLNVSLRHCQAARRIDPETRISINLSPRKLEDEHIVEQVLSSLALWDVPPPALMLEITEGAIMLNPRRSGRLIQRFRDAGVGIALDDFGSGYSSFAYLREFGATELKIDQSFISALRGDLRSQQLVRSMIDLAHHLGMEVVAEGIQDQATFDLVKEFGCDVAQGNHIAAPRPVDEFLALLDSARSAA